MKREAGLGGRIKMKWLLIAWIIVSPGPGWNGTMIVQPFETLQECAAAALTVKNLRSDYKYHLDFGDVPITCANGDNRISQ